METKLDKNRMEKVRRRCNFVNGIEVAAEGSKGGLCLAWKEEIRVTLRNFSRWHIDVLIKEDNVEEWRYTGFYGSPYTKDKNAVWNILRRLDQEVEYPWLVIGDFNEILYSFEKSGGIQRDNKRMKAFRETSEECQLTDIGFSGVWFTWERGNLPETNIRERFDRGVANKKWSKLFPLGILQHLPYSTSDHCPLLLTIKKSPLFKENRKFHFEACWTMEEDIEMVIRDSWEANEGMLLKKLGKLQSCLAEWSRQNRKNNEGLKRKLLKDLEVMLEGELNDDSLAKIIDTKIHLNLEIDKDEMFWKQRARQNWLKLGDKNSAFFHRCALARRKANTISKLVMEEERVIEEESDILVEASSFFKIFSSQMERKILARKEEIQIALEGMGPTKAPGADGFPALFFQRYWHIVGQDVTDYCLGILNNAQDFGDFNNTDIVLIPKVPNPTQLVNFRPISLCTVVYKVVAKAIANRLQKIIDKCIDEVQSAFVPGRLITDNVLLAYEILHTIKQKRTGKKGVMVVKLDMTKAYDRVEWKLLKDVMNKMGFACEWVELLKRCFSSVNYAVNIKGTRGNLFKPSRGLRQGDPLSPFLFLICSEGLSSLMRTAKRQGLVKGAKASRRGPAISHLLFADDCILFGEASAKGAEILKGILKDYENCSGQCVNFSKSTIFFSPNTSEDRKEAVSNLLGVRVVVNPEKYLGLLNMVGRKKRESFQKLLDSISQRIEGWSNRILSLGGKEMESIFAQFWWQKGKGRKGIDWCQRAHLCRSKSEGGLGFCNMAQFNIAMLAKQGWRLLGNPTSLVSRVFKAKYFPTSYFLYSQLGNRNSYVWRSIWAARGILEKGLIWKVGTGTSISIDNDAWVPNLVNSRLLSSFTGLNDSKVDVLINGQNREWNKEMVENTFEAAEAEMILRIPLGKFPHDDILAWRGEPTGVLSVKSSYKLLQRYDPSAYAIQPDYIDFYKKLWCIDLPTKVKINMWKASWNYLPTRVNLHHKKLISDTSCPRCGLETKTMTHLFKECPISVEMWSYLSEVKLMQDSNVDFKQWLTSSIALLSLDVCRFFCGALWAIWGDRNARVHQKRGKTGQEITMFVRNYIKELDDVKHRATKAPKVVTRWKHPPFSFVKINFDGAYDVKNQSSLQVSWPEMVKGKFLTGNTLAHMLATDTLRKKEELYLEGRVPAFAEIVRRNESIREPG
ncbi:reverse transcriptase [Gossypium australe]|uniref:Reverse transcriptase n=1 Tax=Gossypium australe TaxID=47621 RepID=A0A5B6V3U4_9ROSI|nr:reverse transcriptase [Gossypium australe]